MASRREELSRRAHEVVVGEVAAQTLAHFECGKSSLALSKASRDAPHWRQSSHRTQHGNGLRTSIPTSSLSSVVVVSVIACMSSLLLTGER